MSLPTSAATVAQCGPGLGLGIDAGGSRTRWALAGQDGRILGSGVVAGMSALQMAHPGARLALHADLSSLCRAALQLGLPVRVQAGLTGFDVDSDHGRQVGAWLAELLAIDVGCVTLCSDIDIAYLDSFGSDLPGQG
ncbi:MAG: glucosamine kinase, partial [Janthinobacterium sp.]